MFITTGGISRLTTADEVYNDGVPDTFTIGDVIRKARELRHWNQTRLGVEAKKFALRLGDKPINKNTVSKVEKDPYTSEFGTVWRLVAALGLTLTDIDRRIGSPFLSDTELETQLGKAERAAVRRDGQNRKSEKKLSR